MVAIPAGPEVVLIVAIVVLLFGASKIPELARATGEAIGEFRRARSEHNVEHIDVEEAEAEDDVVEHIDEEPEAEAETR